jgi:adenine phosphoribosyltransferase
MRNTILKDWKTLVECSDPHVFEMGNIWSKNNNLELIIDEMALRIKKYTFDKIAAVETKGIIYGSALSAKIGKPLIVFRKKGKIRNQKDRYSVDFVNWENEQDGFEIEKEELNGKKSIIIVDDLVFRLNSIRAIKEIIDKTDYKISSFMCFANLSETTEIEKIPIISLVHCDHT